MVFRTLLVPLKAALGFLLSVVATFGAVVAVFQWGWLAELFGVSSPGRSCASLPIFLIGILFGLAMDYEVFLVTRIREEHMRGDSADDASPSASGTARRVVAAAAVIMISVFAGFMLQATPIIKTIGFALAIGVLVDAFLVRMTIGPGGHVAARRARLVAAALARPGAAATWTSRARACRKRTTDPPARTLARVSPRVRCSPGRRSRPAQVMGRGRAAGASPRPPRATSAWPPGDARRPTARRR